MANEMTLSLPVQKTTTKEVTCIVEQVGDTDFLVRMRFSGPDTYAWQVVRLCYSPSKGTYHAELIPGLTDTHFDVTSGGKIRVV